MRSHVSFVGQNSNGNLEFEPKKNMKFEINANQYNHKTEISRNANNQEIKIQSKTTRRGDNLLDLNSRINGYQKTSHFNINSPIIESQFQAFPSQRSAKIAFKTQTIDHQSEVNGLQRSFNSNTQRNGRLFARINGQFDDQNQLEVEIPQFVAKSNLNFGQRSALVDFHSRLPQGRHLLASVAFNDGFHSEIAWDLEKDPNQRLVLDVKTRREGSAWAHKQLVYSLSASYAGNQLKAETKTTVSEPMRGPHELTLNYIPKYNANKDSLELIVKHEITRDDQMQCQLSYSEGERQRFLAKFIGQKQEGQVTASLETTAPTKPDLEMKVTFLGRQTRDSEIFGELKALKTTLNEEYSMNVKLVKEDRQWKGSARVDSPQSGPQDMEVVFGDNQLKAWTQNQSGKQLEVNVQFQSERSGHKADLELKSNVKGIPSVSVNGVLNEEEIMLLAQVDAERKVDFLLKKSGDYSSGVQITGRFETNVLPKIETKNSLKVNSREIQFQSNVKYDFKDISSVELDAKKESGVWSGNARIAANGAELAKASIESSFGSNSMSYILNAKTKNWSPIKVHFSSEKISSSERKIQINACSQQQQCVDLKTQWKKSSNQVIPEKTFFSLSKIGTNIEMKTSFMEDMPNDSSSSSQSLLGVTTDEKVTKKTRNQFQITVNAHSMGFDQITQRRRHGYDASIRVHCPSNRVIQVKTDYADRQSSGQRDIISKSQVIVDQSTEPLVEMEIHSQTNERRHFSEFKLSSEKFERSPKVIQLEVQRPDDAQKAFSSKLFLDLAQSPNEALTLESQLIERSMNSKWGSSADKNSTLSLNVSTRDKRSIDFQLSAHLSPISGGVHYSNVNRRGQQKRGSLLVKRLTANENQLQRFEVQVKDDDNDYSVDASVSGGKQIQLKVNNQRTREQSDVTVSFDKQCGRVDVRSGQSGERTRFDLCLNAENRNDKIVSLSLERNSEKTVELSLEVDSRDQKTVRASLQWNPEQYKEWQSYSEGVRTSGLRSSSGSEWFGEFLKEVEHKSAVVARQLQAQTLMPLMDQAGDVIQELFQQFRAVQVVQRFVDFVTSALDSSSDWLTQLWQKVIRNARKQCKRQEMCFKAIYALENYGVDSVADLFFESLKRTHRLVMTSSGRVYQSLPSLPDWVSTITEDYRQSISSAIDAVLDSNDDLRQLAKHVTRMAEELQKETEAVNWSEIRRSLDQIKEIVFSSQTSSRVVVWDPKRGKASLEIRSPAIQSRRLRAVLQNVTEEIQKKDSIKSMFF